MDEPRHITKDELRSLAVALRECRWKQSDGVFLGEANGWRITLGSDEAGKPAGSATHNEWGIQLEIPDWIMEKVMDRLKNLN